MADKTHIATDQILADMEAHLSAIYDQAAKDIEEKAAAYFAQFERLDGQKRELLKSGKLTAEEYEAWRRGKMMYGKRWTALKEQIAEQYANVNRAAVAYVNDQLPEVYAINYNGSGAELESAVKGYAFELTDAQTVKNLATSDKTLLPYKYLDGVKDVRWNTQKVNSAVLQGILQGESIPKLARRLRTVTEMNRASAIRNARTTVTSAECKGRQDSYERAEAGGIKLQREWIAAIDGRTRHAHRLLDGQLADVDKPFKSELGEIMYPGDPEAHPSNVYNCRCTIAAKVIGFNKVQVQKATEKAENQERIRRRREEYFARKQQSSEPDFENMTRAQLDKYVSENISAKFGDVSGVNTDFYRKTVKAVKRVETKYGKIDGLNIEFGGIKGNAYAQYDPKTKTLYLKKKGSLSQFADSIAKADEKTMRKYGIKYNAESSYEGTVFHELAHAIDHDGGWSLSKSLGATDDILIKSRSISFYARDRGMPNLPRATEATAENISSYFMGNTDKIDKDVLTIIEEYFKRKKK